MTAVTTVSGQVIDLNMFNRDCVDLEDIGKHLSQIRRFNGATDVGYSVAAHSLHVCELVRLNRGTLAAQLAALHHDAHEYLMGDIASPVKDYLNMLSAGAFSAAEHRLQRLVLDALEVRTAFMANLKLIHHCDMVALATERAQLQPRGMEPWPCLQGIEPDPIDILQRAALPDSYWAQAYVDTDRTLRQAMADRLQYPVKPEVTA